MNKNEISVIIPAFHANKCIKDSIDKIRRVFGRKIEIIVVVNEPEGETFSIVKKIVKKDENSFFLYFGKKLGKGKAILEGFKVASGNIIGFIDADIPFRLEFIKENLTLLYLNECDCLIFSKWKESSFFKVDQRFTRKCLSRCFNLIIKVLFKIDFEDTQGGAKFLKRSSLEKLGDSFICSGFTFDVELIVRLILKDMIIKEIFIENYPSSISTVNIFKDTIPIFRNLLLLKYKLF